MECSFWELGGNSLLAIKLLSILRRKGYLILFQDIFESPSLHILSERLRTSEGPIEQHKTLAPLTNGTHDAKSASAGITVTQMGMIRSSILSPPRGYMLISIGFPWSSEPGYSQHLREAWECVLKRHTVFRTSFDMIEGLQILDHEYVHD